MNKNTKVAFGTLIVSLIVLLLKAKAYYVTLSLAVMSDALETVINVVTAIVALVAVKVAAEPADEDHPYGHGKLEYFSASFEGGLIFFAALAILYQAVKSFFQPLEFTDILSGNIYLIAATAINLMVGLYLIRHGQKENSEALKASGKHIMSDVATSVGVLVGLGLVKWTGLAWVDSAIAFAVGLYLMYEAFQILKTTSGALMDAIDPEIITMLANSLNQHREDEIIDIHNLRMIRSGSFHHIDAHVVVPSYMNVETIHEVTHEFELRVVKDYKYDGEIAFHIDPCMQAYCLQCHMKDCSIRKAEFSQEKKFDQTNLIKGPQYTN